MLKTNKSRALTLVASAALVLSACGATADGPAEKPDADETNSQSQFPEGSTMAELSQESKIKIGVGPGHPGWSNQNLNGEWEGYFIDTAVLLAASLGFDESEIEWIEATPANRIPFLEQRKFDFFAAPFDISEERLKVAEFAGPLTVMPDQMIVQKGNPKNIQSIDDFVGTDNTVCVTQGGSTGPNIREIAPDANIIEFDTITKCIQALRNGSTDAASIAGNLLAKDVSDNPDTFEFAQFEFGAEHPWGIAVSRGQTDFCEFLNEELEALRAAGTLKEIFNNHMGESGLDYPDEFPEDFGAFCG